MNELPRSTGRYLITAITLFFAITVSGVGQDQGSADQIANQAKPVTLSQAINIALANNTDIKRSLLNFEDADEQVRLAWSEVLPEITGSANYTRNLEIPVNFVPAQFFDPDAPAGELVPLQFGTDNNWTGGISVQQTLFRGEAIIGISSSKLFKEAQAENMRATTQQIVTETRIAYYNVLVAREQFRLQQATVDRLSENLRDNEARHKAGLIDEFEVLQVRVQLRNQEPQLTQAKYDVEQAYRELKLVIGVPLDLSIVIRGDLNQFDILEQQAQAEENRDIKKIDRMTPYEFEPQADLIDIATDQRGDIRMLQTQNQLKEREIMAIKSRFMPTLTASYNLNWSASQAGNPVFFGREDSRARSQTIGVTLSLPIFQGFQRNANLSIAQIERKDIEEQERAVERAAKNEIQSAKESLNESIETASARESALELAREGYQRAIVRLENGMGSQLDVTNAELQLREAEANYAQMVFNYLTAKARYDQAIGLVPFVDEKQPIANN